MITLQESVYKRIKHLDKVKKNRRHMALEIAMCAADLVHWVNHWCWTYDPREAVPTVPFDLFPRQEAFLRWIAEREERQEDGLMEKSRDMGASWLCCAYALHGWLFHQGYQVGFGSRKLEYVDAKGDPKSIFEKIRMLLAGLPPWMLPPKFDEKKHSGCAKLINPANGATITGEGGDNIGRGARSSIYFVDEAAFLERPQLIDRALSQTTRCRIEVSTPNGPGNPFAIKRQSGKLPVFTFHWRDDPRKGETWYVEQKRKYDPVTVAQEIDIDYSASIEGICIPAAWVRAAVELDLGDWSKSPCVAGLDISEEGKNQTVMISRRGPVVGSILDWGQCNTTQTAWRARDHAEQQGVKILNYDVGGVGAGVRGTWQSSEKPLTFQANAVNAGEHPTEARWPDGKSSRERFINLRAEMAWMLRCRFEKAFEFREQGIKHPMEEMISIPNHPQLIMQLSLPLYFHTETGKIKIESKNDMRSRGVKSPDHADALALAFLEMPKRRLQVWT